MSDEFRTNRPLNAARRGACGERSSAGAGNSGDQSRTWRDDEADRFNRILAEIRTKDSQEMAAGGASANSGDAQRGSKENAGSSREIDKAAFLEKLVERCWVGFYVAMLVTFVRYGAMAM